MEKITEWCPHCTEEVELDAIPKIQQECPSCGEMIRACNMCDECDYSCEIDDL